MARVRVLEQAAAALPRHAGWVLLGVAALTLLAGVALFDRETGGLALRVDASLERLLPDDAPARLFYERTRRLFGNDEALFVVLGAPDVFTPEVLSRVRATSRRIAALPEVAGVVSLTEAPLLRAENGDLVVAPAVAEVPETPEALAALRASILGHPLLAGTLVSPGGDATALVVTFHELSNREYLESGIDDRIVAIAREAADAGAGIEVWVTGGPHLYVEGARVLLSDLARLPALMLLGLGVVLAFAFRSVRGVVLPLLTVAVGIVWTLGAIAALGVELNAVTTLVPPLLAALGLSYAVHVVSEWGDVLREDGGGDRRAVIGEAMGRVALPLTLTALTTAAGLGSLLLSPLAAVRDFGGLATLGVLAAALAALTLTPGLLAVLPLPRRPPPAGGDRFDRLAGALAAFDLRRRRAIFVAAALVVVGAAIATTRVQVGTQQIGKFPADASARVDFEAINARMEGANPLLLVLETSRPQGFLEPDILREVERLQVWLEEQPEIGGTTSLVDTLGLVHRALREDPDAPAVPATRSGVSQLLFFAASDDLARFVDAPLETTSVQVRARVIDSAELSGLAARVEARLAKLPEGLTGRLTGPSLVFNQALDEIIRGQTLSVVAALGIVYLLLSLLFVSLRVGLLALIPNVLPLAGFFGALGVSGVLLSPGTSLIAPMVLGIAVDDTIHYFARFLREARRLGDESRATVATLRAVGRPITWTTAALCVGLLMLHGSGFTSQGELGSMAAFSLAFAWLCDVTFTPALCAGLRITSLWDLLAIDLGEDPSRAIRLFHGLSAPRARLVALLGSVVEVRSGERLWRAGEPGGALYVVVDGKLRASVAQPDGTLELQAHERGDLVGEVGFFHDRRAADLEVVADARLLRITRRELDALASRYPRVASRVASNLNEVLAQRLAGATRLLAPSRAGPEDPEELRRRERALDDAFFRAEAVTYRAELMAKADSADAQAEVDGGLASRLSGLGVGADTLAALTLIPLVEVAWADGRLDPDERGAVLRGAEGAGVAPGSPSHALLGVWLETAPDAALHEAWREFMEAVCAELSIEARHRLRTEIIGRARTVAEASGGLLGLRTVSRAEEQALERLESAFLI